MPSTFEVKVYDEAEGTDAPSSASFSIEIGQYLASVHPSFIADPFIALYGKPYVRPMATPSLLLTDL